MVLSKLTSGEDNSIKAVLISREKPPLAKAAGRRGQVMPLAGHITDGHRGRGVSRELTSLHDASDRLTNTEVQSLREILNTSRVQKNEYYGQEDYLPLEERIINSGKEFLQMLVKLDVRTDPQYSIPCTKESLERILRPILGNEAIRAINPYSGARDDVKELKAFLQQQAPIILVDVLRGRKDEVNTETTATEVHSILMNLVRDGFTSQAILKDREIVKDPEYLDALREGRDGHYLLKQLFETQDLNEPEIRQEITEILLHSANVSLLRDPTYLDFLREEGKLIPALISHAWSEGKANHHIQKALVSEIVKEETIPAGHTKSQLKNATSGFLDWIQPGKRGSPELVQLKQDFLKLIEE